MKPVSTNGMALTGFILGIMSVTIGCIICPPAFSIPGLIFSLIGRGQIRQSGEGGQGLAFTGILLSSISLGIMLLFIVGYIVLITVGMATGSLEDFK